MAKQFLIGAVVLLFLYILSPFLVSIAMALVCAVLFRPWMKRIDTGRFPNALAAGLFTLAVTSLIFLPISGMIVLGVKSGLAELKHFNYGAQLQSSGSVSSGEVFDKLIDTLGINKALIKMSRIAPINPNEVTDLLKDVLGSLALKVGDLLSIFAGRIPNMVVTFVVFLFSFYYFLADGVTLLNTVRQGSFFSKHQTERLIRTFAGLCRSVILASIISGGVQALLAAVMALSIGIPQFHIVFLVVFVTSFVPLVGSFPVVAGIALVQFANGRITQGIVMAVAAVVIGAVDNFIRPQVIRGNSNLHPLLGFVSAIGGLEVFGVAGVFLGPVICGMCLELFDMGLSQSKSS